jgi:Arc/MetJ-type ribon-helix-helix transcriptional regulator
MYALCMSSKTINISLPEELLRKLDRASSDEFTSRSDFIRDSIVRRLKHQKVVDEWGDDGEWETIVDFRAINPIGVPSKEVLSALKQLTK